MADFIYIDGVEYKADKELVDLIKNHANNSLNNSFERQTKGTNYYYIGNEGVVHKTTELEMPVDNNRYEIGSYCTNEELLKKRVAEENLFRKMWRFSLTHGGDKIDWSTNRNVKWYLVLDIENKVSISNTYFRQAGVIYFNSKEVAEEARELFEKELKEVYGITND